MSEKADEKANGKAGAEDRKIIPMRKAQEQQSRWMRANDAMEYFHVCRNTLNKIARECDAVGKIGDKILIYDVQRIERYIKVR